MQFITWGLSGRQSKELYAVFRSPSDTFSDAGTAVVQLMINSYVRRELEFFPRTLNAVWPATGDTCTLLGELVNTGGAPCTVRSLAVDTSTGLRLRCPALPAPLEPGGRLVFTVTAVRVPGTDPPKRISGRVVVRTAGTRYPVHGCGILVFPR